MSVHAKRRKKLRALLRKSRLPALLVTHPTNVTYLTGFTGEDSFLLVTSKDAVLLSDARFTTQIEQECSEIEVVIRTTPTTLLDITSQAIRKSKLSAVGFEAQQLSVAVREAFESTIGAEWVGTDGLIEQLRVIKDAQEISAIRRAVFTAEKAIAAVTSSMLPQQTELDVVREIEYQIRRFGGTGCSFPPIVGVGPRAALPHAPPTNRQIGDDKFVLIDWGAREQLYVSDLTRVFATGKISPKFERMYGLVLSAQLRGIQAIRPGVTAESVDAAARKVIEKAGFGKQFSHGLGHGIGLDVHEAPRLAAKQPLILEAGMVVTIEPGVYLPGWGGIRIEDDVLVTRDGHEVLSKVSKELDDCVIRW